MAGTTTSNGDMPVEAQKPLVDSIKSLFENPEFSDFTIKCQDKSWRAHKTVVATRSEFFKKACTGLFKEGRVGVVILPDDDKSVVHEMLRYLYTGSYHDDSGDAKQSDLTPILFNVHMHTIADKYDIPPLVTLAEAKFAERAEEEWISADFANAIEEVYATAPDSKRAMQLCAVDTAALHSKTLFGTESGKRFREVADSTPAFLFEVATRMASGLSKRKREEEEHSFKCGSCTQIFTTVLLPLRTHFYCPRCAGAVNMVAGKVA